MVMLMNRQKDEDIKMRTTNEVFEENKMLADSETSSVTEMSVDFDMSMDNEISEDIGMTLNNEMVTLEQEMLTNKAEEQLIRVIDNMVFRAAGFRLSSKINTSEVTEFCSNNAPNNNYLFEGDDEVLCNMNEEQQPIFDEIIAAVESFTTGTNDLEYNCFFIDGPAGTGKTTLYKHILFYMKSKRLPAIATAYSGIAALLLPNGTTLHSVAKIPIPCDIDSYCSWWYKNSDRIKTCAEPWKDAVLLIIDEVSMLSNDILNCLNRSLKRLRNSNKPFGGLLMIFGGDFRQILPVIKHAKRAKIVSQTIVNHTSIWQYIKRFSLKTNMRLLSNVKSCTKKVTTTLIKYSLFLEKVGEGRFDSDKVTIPEYVEVVRKPKDLIRKTYKGQFRRNGTIIITPKLYNTAIVCPTNKGVDYLNASVLAKFPGEEKTFCSVDELIQDNSYVKTYPIEIINNFEAYSLPPHKLHLKIGVPLMILRNLNVAKGLCNGTRVILEEMSSHVLKVRKIENNKQYVLPRIWLNCEEDKYPVKFTRLQFPVRLCFAMTINKSQGQTIGNLGVYLNTSVFTHGQLNVALSRVQDPRNLCVCNPGKKPREVRNVVYPEIIHKIVEGKYEENTEFVENNAEVEQTNWHAPRIHRVEFGPNEVDISNNMVEGYVEMGPQLLEDCDSGEESADLGESSSEENFIFDDDESNELQNAILKSQRVETVAEEVQFRNIDVSDNVKSIDRLFCYYDEVTKANLRAAMGVFETVVPNAKLINVQGDGNCLFRCLAQAIWSDENRYQEIRNCIADEIASNTDDGYDETGYETLLIDNEITVPGKEENKTCREVYAESVRTRGVYGSAHELRIFCKLFNKNIEAIRADTTTCAPVNLMIDQPDENGTPIKLVCLQVPNCFGSEFDHYMLIE